MSHQLDQIFEAFNQLKVLIVGDVMIDSYLWGGVDRISPEAPVPIVNVKSREQRLGGAANVALNIKSLGATPYMVTVIGDDIDGTVFEEITKKEGLPTEGLVKSNERITTIKHRIIASNQHVLRVDQEQTDVLSQEDKAKLLSRVEALLPACDVLILQDYDKGVLSPDIIDSITAKAIENKVPITVDPKKNNFEVFKNVDLFKPNLKELKEGTKLDFNNKDLNAVKKAVAQLKASQNQTGVMVTLSEQGVYIDKESQHHLPAHIRKIADVSGAGDTVISVASLAVALKTKSAFIAGISNLSGGLVCESVGVVPIDKERLKQEAIEHNLEQWL